jgi:hypothetical protein
VRVPRRAARGAVCAVSGRARDCSSRPRSRAGTSESVTARRARTAARSGTRREAAWAGLWGLGGRVPHPPSFRLGVAAGDVLETARQISAGPGPKSYPSRPPHPGPGPRAQGISAGLRGIYSISAHLNKPGGHRRRSKRLEKLSFQAMSTPAKGGASDLSNQKKGDHRRRWTGGIRPPPPRVAPADERKQRG